MKKKTPETEIISFTKYLFTRYRLAMYGHLNRMLASGVLRDIVGFDFRDTVINKKVCRFPSVQYWRISHTSFYADVSGRLHLQTDVGFRIWCGTLTIAIEATEDESLLFLIEDLDSESPDREDCVMLSPFLVPYLKNQDMEEEALCIRRQYLPNSKMLCTERCGEALAKAMGLTIQYLPLENQKIDSILFYIDDTINTKDKNAPKDDPPVVVSIPANTIVININSIRKDYSEFNILHECVHYDEHFLFFRLQEAKNNDASKLRFKQDDDEKTCGDPIYWMERQANRIAYALLIPREDFLERTNEALSNVTYYRNSGDQYERAIDALSSVLQLPDFRLRARMVQLGHILSKGACNYVDRHRISPFGFDLDSLPGEEYTFNIDKATAYDLYKEKPEFRALLDTGDYAHVDGHIVRNTEAFVRKGYDGAELTEEALESLDRCALRFIRDYEYRQAEPYQHGRILYDSDYVKRTAFYLNDTINRQQLDELDAQRDYTEHFPRNFRDAINLLAHQNGLNRDEMAERLGMDARTLDRWISDPDRKLTADFIMLVTLELQIPDWISNLLFKRAHIQLDEEEPRHMALKYIQRVLWMDGVQKANEFLEAKKLGKLTV